MTDVAKACDWTQAAEWTFEPLDDRHSPLLNSPAIAYDRPKATRL